MGYLSADNQIVSGVAKVQYVTTAPSTGFSYVLLVLAQLGDSLVNY